MNISSLKRSAITASFVVLFGTALTAQPKPENNIGSEFAAQARLENLMITTEQSIKYIAPDAYATEKQLTRQAPAEEVERAFANLGQLAIAAEKDLAYQAPSAEVVNALDNLDLLAEVTVKELKYSAPSVNEESPVGPGVEFAHRRNKSDMPAAHKVSRLVKVAPEYTLQESWLINAGYYKTTRTPIWNKIYNGIKSRQAARQYANKF